MDKSRSRCAIAALFLAGVFFPAVAQAVTYAHTPIAFSWIDPTSHTLLSAASAPAAFRTLGGCGTGTPVIDDTISDPLSLGFNFQFAGVVVDSVRVVSNGRLQFLNQNPANGTVFDNTACGFGTPDQFPFPNASVPYTMKVYGADIDPSNIEEAVGYATRCSLTGAGSGPFGSLPCSVRYATTGSAPNRQFVVTWNNVPEWTNGSTPQGNFQLQVIVREDGTFIYQYGANSSVSVAEIGWQADPNVGDFDLPNVGARPPQNRAEEFYAPVPTSVTATGGTPQSTVINTAFAAALQVTVLDQLGFPLAGVTVNFAAPGSGASATLSSASAVTDASGVASVTATANAIAGSYSVTGSVAGVVTPATFSLTNTVGGASTMTANAGTTPQSAAINTAFANPPAVTVRDAGSNPVPGVSVTFTAPGAGPSGLFSNSTTIIVVVTDASGIASAPFTANSIAGGPYTVTAAATGLSTVNFSLTNLVGAPASVTANAGSTPQSATINTAFANPLSVTVRDSGNNPVPGVTVSFAAPGSGASATLTPSSAVTNASGVASVSATANATAGSYSVTASVVGVVTPATFSLTNTVGAPASVTANAGSTPQSTTINTAFANPLSVTVRDAGNNPVPGVTVNFAAPGSGASATLSSPSAMTDAGGVASVTATANATVGSYSVSASVVGVVSPATFSLTNTVGAPTSMTANAGTTPQSATINTAFANPLAVTVRDAGNNPVPGVNVTFTAPGAGPSGLFSNSTTAIVVATNASGIASAPFTANSIAGGPYAVNAAATGLSNVNFSLTNTVGAPASMTANPGTTPQSATINTAFANPLAVTVRDVGNNPVPGVNVTFTAPGAGPSGLFSNSTTTIVVTTNAVGVASAPFTANSIAGGPYTVTAAATGLSTVNFSLTNTVGAPASMTANAGTTPQSATINTAFANPLAVTVRDVGNNPVPGVNVTFTAPGAGPSGLFGNSTTSIVVTTNAMGVASAPFTANSIAGGPYIATAAATGLATVNFSLTNTVGAPATMTANAGTTPQSATINTAFANPLAVTVRDVGNNPVPGVNVTFTAPGAGPSGLFSNSTTTIVVTTNAVGVASAPFTANSVAGGPYTVTAAATGLGNVNFSLTNNVGVPVSMTANPGSTPQSATINTAFANPLAVTVRDIGNNPVPGVNVTFTAPGSGSSGLFSNNTTTIVVTTNAAGIASAPFTANSIAGGPYTVTAAATGLTTVNFSLTNNVGAPASMTANAGTTPQTATINTAFANPLAVTVRDVGNNPVPGVSVTFTAPASGASGLFSNSTTTIVVATNAAGIASAPFTANSTAGGPYNVTAAATGLTTVNFSLTNAVGAPASMTANAGTTPQSATISTAFANPLAVTVRDVGNNPVPGVNVTFTAPGSGASGLFSNSTTTIVVATNAAGIASAPFTANSTAGGPYNVTAAATGLTTVNFSLTNTVGAPATMTANAGTTPQSATINTAFANPLAVTVRDSGNNPVPGVNVTFTAPGSGASGLFTNSTATIVVATNAAGIASAPFTANSVAGGPYTVTAAATGLTTVNFSLTNTAGAASSMTANAGTTPQSATINTAFANPLAVTVRDASNNPVPGVNVTFTAPGSGASGVFSNSTATIVVATNASGVASAPFTANATAGGPYTVTAAATGLTTVNFSLTNTAGASASMTANAGTTPQSATINTAFANPLAVTVRDVGNNPVAGVNVTFTAPGSGASGLFSNSTLTIVVATNAAGVASAPFTANGTAGGSYNVTAAATGLATINFSLTNSAGAAASMTANAGTTPQSATINTAFTNPLAVTLRDASSNPVAGVNVTFTAPGSGASGLFTNSSTTIVVATNAAGVASAPFTANATAGGPYTVTAAAAGLPTVNFSLSNTTGTASSMTANPGSTPQSATVNTPFANPLAVTVRDAGNNPVAGVSVTFAAPASGPSGVFSNGTTTIVVATDAAGVASVPFTAGGVAGGPYAVTATAAGLTSVNFSLTNVAATVVIVPTLSTWGLIALGLMLLMLSRRSLNK